MISPQHKLLGENIKKFRNRTGLSQIALARTVGSTSAAYITFIEQGKRNISAIDLLDLAKALGTTPDVLLGVQLFKEKDPVIALRSTSLSKESKEKVIEYYNLLRIKEAG